MKHNWSIDLTEQAQPVFIRANRYIIDKYKTVIRSTPSGDAQTQLLKDLWYKEYGARVEGSFDTLVFENEKKLTLFLLKWN